jgi:PAS domain S-box-containing protein
MITELLLEASPLCQFKVVKRRDLYVTAIREFKPDVILSDNSIPGFSASEALEYKTELQSSIPFIMVSGTSSKKFEAFMIGKGADDYVLKDSITRLPAAIETALKQKKIEGEKLEAERKCDEAARHLKTIFENTSESFLLMETNGIVKALNSRASEYGFLIGEKKIKVGDNIFNLISKDKNSFFREMASRVLEGEKVHYERNYRMVDGNELWIDLSIYPVEEEGMVQGICVRGQDITEKKKIEQEREFEQNNLAALINNTEDLLWSVDKNFKLITSNDSFANVITAASGKPIDKDFNLLETKFGKEQIERFKKYYERAFRGETFREVESYGSLWSEISFYPIYNKHEIEGTACYSRDITERRKALASLEATLKELADYKAALDESFIISITNPQGIITYVNRNFCEISKYTADELLGKSHSILISAFHDEAFFKHLWDTILAGKIWRNEIKCKARDGEIFWVDTTIIPFFDNKGNPVEFVSISMDITEKKAIEKELFNQKVQEQKKITRAILAGEEKERNRLSRELHDNVNQLLATAKLYLGTAARDNPEFKEKIKYPLELIDHSMEELRSLSHRMGSRFIDIDLRSTIESLLVKISQSTTIKTRLKFSLGSLVLTDDLKLNLFRIVQEQTHNILKYAHAKSIDIGLTEKEGILNIIIKDDGDGFDINTKRSGIGLSNIQDRVTSFNGHMEIISSPGNGCSIVIKIPLR